MRRLLIIPLAAGLQIQPPEYRIGIPKGAVSQGGLKLSNPSNEDVTVRVDLLPPLYLLEEEVNESVGSATLASADSSKMAVASTSIVDRLGRREPDKTKIAKVLGTPQGRRLQQQDGSTRVVFQTVSADVAGVSQNELVQDTERAMKGALSGTSGKLRVSRPLSGAFVVDDVQEDVEEVLSVLDSYNVVAEFELDEILEAQGYADAPGEESGSDGSTGFYSDDPVTQWAKNEMRLPGAWSIAENAAFRERVGVGVVDTGVVLDLLDLEQNIYKNKAEVGGTTGVDDDGNEFVDDYSGWNFVYMNNDPTDDHGHGTHVAGIIGAVGNNGYLVAGVNWMADVTPCKFLEADGRGSSENARRCLEYMATLPGVRIINASYGGSGYSAITENLLRRLANQGILVVAAAGNLGVNTDETPFYPACFDVPNVVSIGASSPPYDPNPFASNYGATTVHAAAPGKGINSLGMYENAISLTGTSMAAPHVAGLASLMWRVNPYLLYTDIVQILRTATLPHDYFSTRTIWGGAIDAQIAMETTMESWWVKPAYYDSWKVTEAVTIPAGGNVVIPFEFKALRQGTYRGVITVDDGSTVRQVPVEITETDPPKMESASIPQMIEVPSGSEASVPISNVGGGVLSVDTLPLGPIEVEPTGTLYVMSGDTTNLTVRCQEGASGGGILNIDIASDISQACPTALHIDVLCQGEGLRTVTGHEGDIVTFSLEVDPMKTTPGTVDYLVNVLLDSPFSNYQLDQYNELKTVDPVNLQCIPLAPNRNDDGAAHHDFMDFEFTMFDGPGLESFRMSTNGLLDFSTPPGTRVSDWRTRFDSIGLVVAPAWADLYHIAGESSMRVCENFNFALLEWKNFGTYYKRTAGLTMRALLYRDGSVVFSYVSNAGHESNSTVGRVGLNNEEKTSIFPESLTYPLSELESRTVEITNKRALDVHVQEGRLRARYMSPGEKHLVELNIKMPSASTEIVITVDMVDHNGARSEVHVPVMLNVI